MSRMPGPYAVPRLSAATYSSVDDRAPLAAQPCDQLPPAARDLLVLASQLADPHERRMAIDHAIERVKLRFPELFHPQE